MLNRKIVLCFERLCKKERTTLSYTVMNFTTVLDFCVFLYRLVINVLIYVRKGRYKLLKEYTCLCCDVCFICLIINVVYDFSFEGKNLIYEI